MTFGYINKAGQPAFSETFLWAGPFLDETACVKSEKFGWGFIDLEGRLRSRAPDFQNEPTQFFEGLALIGKHKLYGFMDTDGKICIEPRYRSAAPFSEGVAPVLTGEGYAFIDRAGVVVSKEYFSRLGRFSDGLALAKRGGHFYFLNRDLKSVLGPFDKANDFREGMARVVFEGVDCFIDSEGNVAFENQWDYLSHYSFDGRIGFAKDDKYGFLDNHGRIVVQPEYDNIENFSDRIAVVESESRKWAIDVQGVRLFVGEFDSLGPYSEQLAAFSRNQKWGYADRTGMVCIKEQYDVANVFKNGLAPVAGQ